MFEFTFQNIFTYVFIAIITTEKKLNMDVC